MHLRRSSRLAVLVLAHPLAAAAASHPAEQEAVRRSCVSAGGGEVRGTDLAPLFRSDVEDYPPIFG